MTGRWIAVALVAAALRLPSLEIRPMHGDEAVMAVKAGALAWGGEGAAYDPTGYHGTLLGWLARPVLMLSGAKSLADTDERHFRLVTAMCGILLCLTPILLADGLGRNGALIAGLLLAVSPAFVYWSRFYIQEVPLVLATALCIGCGWRYSRSKTSGWLWGAGVSAGLMLSLKETAWLSFIAGGVGLAAVKSARAWIGTHWTRLVGPAVAALAIPAAILGPATLLAPLHYWELGVSGGDHAHPWHWYVSSVLDPRRGAPDAVVFLLALAVLSRLGRVAVQSKSLLSIMLIWAGMLGAVYSVLPYKTPWCALQFLFGAILVAGAGMGVATERGSARPGRDAIWLVPVFTGLFIWGAVTMSFVRPADRRNPFVYAQPVEDVRRLGKLIRSLASVHPKGREMIIAVSAENPWPLPWELRGFPNVGYWQPGDPEARPAFKAAAIRISPATPDSPGMMFGVRPREILSVETDRRWLDGALRQH